VIHFARERTGAIGTGYKSRKVFPSLGLGRRLWRRGIHYIT
jgi:hypothetical protein